MSQVSGLNPFHAATDLGEQLRFGGPSGQGMSGATRPQHDGMS